ncbi:MAG: recombinase family protein [Opitutus sp.]|nr:recombinase family protein [Opitutus sp.]MCS6246050.1 recombinase family protein [Opitutus sp.]MCS6273933.1 recombinase family protein [Opitutus sp.]MCS6276223.1 recombinase family protein [Opitutus sp.]MCS6301317.1 recombinase family protein [Opitutus sp.]
MGGPTQLPLPSTGAAAIPAAAYVRMSTEHQQYSTENQLDRIKEYAARRGMEIVRVFEDAGKSGLNVRGRESLRRMIDEVEKGMADFKCILAYDVSRWGRFQDADESGYYEYICKRAGITVHYCAEQFENDGSPTSNIIKSVKRSMAGEYSRELSTKVFQGACRLIQLGYKQGGTAGYGLRRMLVDQAGQPKGVLAVGEHKSLQTDRVVLALGPDEEVAVVRGVYRAFLDESVAEQEIADRLNGRGLKTDLGRPWTRGTVHQLLTNEKYLGNNVYHRTSFKLKRKHVQNPPDMWIRVQGAFPAIVSAEDFTRVQEVIIARAKRFSDDEMLDKLRDVLRQHGHISGVIIDEREDLPSSAAFRNRFGSLVRAYQLIGYVPETDFSFIEVNRFLRQKHPEVVQEVITELAKIGVRVQRDPETELLVLDQELVVSLVLSRCLRTEAGSTRWLVRFEASNRPDITVVARMDETNQAIKDYYLFPALDQLALRLRLAECNDALLDAYRFDDLAFFYEMTERISIEEVA